MAMRHQANPSVSLSLAAWLLSYEFWAVLQARYGLQGEIVSCDWCESYASRTCLRPSQRTALNSDKLYSSSTRAHARQARHAPDAATRIDRSAAASEQEARQMDVRIAYASETGRAEALAWRCRSWLRLRNVATSDPVPLDALTDATTTIIFAATAGDGAPPSNAKKFWSALLRKGAPRLEGKRYALYGLGDARYGAKYNAFARRLDARLVQLGAARLCERALGDACTVEGAESLLPGFFARLSPALGVSAALEASLQGRVGDEAPTASRTTRRPSP